jgi:hypothetical protein
MAVVSHPQALLTVVLDQRDAVKFRQGGIDLLNESPVCREECECSGIRVTGDEGAVR